MILRIKVRLFVVILFGAIQTSFGTSRDQLSHADSLFSQQRYTQALSIYQDIFDHGNTTASMLLKMAFIQDASGNYTDALYYLDLYYQLSADRNVVGKIAELANANDLYGYRYDDADYLTHIIQKNQSNITWALLALSLLLLTWIYRRARSNERAYPAFILQLFVAGVLFVVSNVEGKKEAIITSDHTLLRSGPSAGAEPIEVINKGHKVRIVDQTDVWTKIIWDAEERYVRNSRLKII